MKEGYLNLFPSAIVLISMALGARKNRCSGTNAVIKAAAMIPFNKERLIVPLMLHGVSGKDNCTHLRDLFKKERTIGSFGAVSVKERVY